MAETIDEITVDWTDDATKKQIVKMVKKEVLTRGAWTTIVFMYQDLDRKTDTFGPPKIRVGRYKKSGGKYMSQSKFNISNAKQAKQIVEVINKWLPEMGDEEEK